jgi:dihydroorotase
LDVRRTIECVEANRDLISGIKVRMAGTIMSDEQLWPLALAERVARSVNLPLMLHVGEAPPKLAEMEPYLKKGDIITHIFSGLCPGLWEDDGRPTWALARCLERGVRLDIGHGGGSFSFDVFEKARSHGLPQLAYGTDMHRPSMAGSLKTMSNFLSKMYGMKASLTEMMWGLTNGPAEILGLEDWCDYGEKLQNVTLFEIVPDDEHRPQVDCQRETRYFDHLIKATGVVYDGAYRPLVDELPQA